MRIDSPDLSPVKVSNTQSQIPAEAKIKNEATGFARATKSDSANVSNISQRMLDIEKNISANEPFDISKVDRIKTAIQEGRYHVNTEAISSKIIESAKMMISSQPAKQFNRQTEN